MSRDVLRQNTMMAHLLDALEATGHWPLWTARLAMVARHFLSEDELTALRRHNPGINDHEARSLYLPGSGVQRG